MNLGEFFSTIRRGLKEKRPADDCEFDLAEMENSRRDKARRIDERFSDVRKSVDALETLVREMQSIPVNGKKVR